MIISKKTYPIRSFALIDNQLTESDINNVEFSDSCCHVTAEIVFPNGICTRLYLTTLEGDILSDQTLDGSLLFNGSVVSATINHKLKCDGWPNDLEFNMDNLLIKATIKGHLEIDELSLRA